MPPWKRGGAEEDREGEGDTECAELGKDEGGEEERGATGLRDCVEGAGAATIRGLSAAVATGASRRRDARASPRLVLHHCTVRIHI